jgi:hypothetical protein
MTMAVAANKDWQKTGLQVRKGQTLIVLYDGGLWTFDQSIPPTDGIGTPGLTDARAPVPDSNLGFLVAKIGNGPPFPIGNQATLQMDRTGPLFLRINEAGDLRDNEGSLNMKIRIEPAP